MSVSKVPPTPAAAQAAGATATSAEALKQTEIDEARWAIQDTLQWLDGELARAMAGVDDGDLMDARDAVEAIQGLAGDAEDELDRLWEAMR